MRTNPVTRDEDCLDFVSTNLECTAPNAHCEDSDSPSTDRDSTTSCKHQDSLSVNDTTPRKRPIKSEDFTMPEICTMWVKTTETLRGNASSGSTENFYSFSRISFAAIGVFLFCCTICDFVRRNRPADQSATLNTLAQFSLYTNAVALLVQRPTAETMAAIHGIRCLCCFLVIHVHRYIVMAAAVETRYTLLEVFRVSNEQQLTKLFFLSEVLTCSKREILYSWYHWHRTASLYFIFDITMYFPHRYNEQQDK